MQKAYYGTYSDPWDFKPYKCFIGTIIETTRFNTALQSVGIYNATIQMSTDGGHSWTQQSITSGATTSLELKLDNISFNLVNHFN